MANSDDDAYFGHIPTSGPFATNGNGIRANPQVAPPPGCPNCSKRFQLNHVPATHKKCPICDKHFHKWRIQMGFSGGSSFVCDT